MRNLLTVSVAAAALFAAVSAHAEAVGHIGANYARTDTDVAGFDIDSDTWQLEGAAAFDVGGLGAQIDGSVTDSDSSDAVWAATGHLNGNLGAARVGGFVGFAASSGDTLWGLGLEAQGDVGASTVLYAQAGYAEIDDLDLDAWALRGEVRHYLNDNFRLTGSLGYVNVDQRFLGDADVWNIGAEAEYKFASSPFSVFGGYQHTDANKLRLNSDTFQVGVRFTFGDTLRSRDAGGAMLGSLTKLVGGIGF